jgi:hypothetical protein
VVGDYGIILRTSNGSTNWSYQTSNTSEFLYSVYLTENNTCWVVGSNGTILRNGIAQASGSTQVLRSVHFINNSVGWVVGDYGTILKTTTGGATFIEDETNSTVSKEFFLAQNYPNPFNPSTTIRYSVPQSSQVVIKVFDVLGNEKETLVSEEKPAGTYEITWYAEGFPSGVYFYKLQTNEFVETKNMILLR